MVQSSAIRRLFLTFVLSCVILAVFVVDDGAAAPYKRPKPAPARTTTTPRNVNQKVNNCCGEYDPRLPCGCGGLGGVKKGGSNDKKCPPNMQVNDDGECRPIAN